jgi:signal transduction histidine kinase/integral membrane sensor domain MASE1
MALTRFGNRLQQEPWRSLGAIALTAVIYFWAERYVTNSALLRIGTDTPPLNPGSGFALVALLFYGPVAFIGIGLGVLWTAIEIGIPKAALVGNLLGQLLESGLGYWFLRTLNVHPHLGTLRSVVTFGVLAALLPTSLNATLTTASSYFGKIVPLPSVTTYWWSLWRSHALGVWAIAPVCLILNQGRSLNLGWLRSILHHRQLRQLLRPQTWSFVLWTLALLISGWVALDRVHPTLPWLEYLPFLFLAWSIARFSQRGGIIAGFGLSLVACWYTFRGQGLFLEQAGNLSLGITNFQGWVAIVTGIALAFGAALQERQHQIEQLRNQPPQPLGLTETSQTDRLINDVATRIRSSLNVSAILQQTVEEVRELLNADRVCLYQTAESGEGIVTAESVARDWNSAADDCIPPPIVADMQALYTQQRLIVRNDTSQVELPPFLQTYNQRFHVKASMNMSLVKDNVHFGLLAVHQCNQPRTWTPTEIDLVQRLVPQVEWAVQQGSLYEELQAHAHRMEQQVSDRTQRLRDNMAELVDLNESKDRLLHAVSHDLRTPALGMLMLLHRLAMQSDDSISLPKPMLDKMIDSTNRQINLIQALLNDYTAEEGGAPTQTQSFQLLDLANSSIEALHHTIEANQGYIDNQIPADLPVIQGDMSSLRRVLDHLITNALQHNPPKTKLVLQAEVLEDTKQIRCAVIDDGVGISTQQAQDLFQRPYLRNQTDRHLTGIGLGLFLSRQIVQAHGGEVGVDSTLSEGATFWFTLPYES